MIKNIINIEDSELIWLDQHHEITLEELAELSGLSLQELHYLVESGVMTPTVMASNSLDGSLRFSNHLIAVMRKLSRLKHDFELEPNTLSLMLVFLERIHLLETQLHKPM